MSADDHRRHENNPLANTIGQAASVLATALTEYLGRTLEASSHRVVEQISRNLPKEDRRDTGLTSIAHAFEQYRDAIGDLADTRIDPLAQEVRKILRQKYAFPAAGPFGIAAVYSTEHPRPPVELHYDEGEGFRCVCPGGKNEHHSCEERRLIYGTASFVTGSFGLCCASVAVRHLAQAQGASGSARG